MERTGQRAFFLLNPTKQKRTRRAWRGGRGSLISSSTNPWTRHSLDNATGLCNNADITNAHHDTQAPSKVTLLTGLPSSCPGRGDDRPFLVGIGAPEGPGQTASRPGFVRTCRPFCVHKSGRPRLCFRLSFSEFSFPPNYNACDVRELGSWGSGDLVFDIEIYGVR